jgi:hypothetical protein
MTIAALHSEAARIFSLEVADVTLVLFCAVPVTLRSGSISGPPRVAPGSKVMVFCFHGSHARASNNGALVPIYQGAPSRKIPALNSKLLSSFKLPKFDGVLRSWKLWEKSFQRFLGLHQLDYVLEEDFLESLWVVPDAKAANKMVFFLIEDAVATGTLASKLVRQATKWNGHEAFIILRNGYVFNGPQTATILLSEISRLRLLRDEDASSFCLRLIELIEDLELVPGDAAVFLTDTQKLGYLLSAIRHETSLQAVYAQLQSEQLRGTITFEQACRELHHRVESTRADDFLDGRSGKALVSTELKKNGQGAVPVAKVLCLAKDCSELIQSYLPLCKLCYLQSMAGKVSVLALRDGLGNAVFNTTTKKLDFPAGVPKSRFPQKGLKKGRKVLMAGLTSVPVWESPSLEKASTESFNHDLSQSGELTNQDLEIFDLSDSNVGVGSFLQDNQNPLTNQEIGIVVDTAPIVPEIGRASVEPSFPTAVRCLFTTEVSSAQLYVDSGAGQSLSSCSTAFVQMVPCQVEITGIAGALQIYGRGTALFLYDDGSGHPALLRVHNCLYGHGGFNLLSVSQVCQKEGNSVDFTLGSPAMILRSKRRLLRIPLTLEDGLFAVSVCPFQMDDPRYSTLPKYDVTPNGEFRVSDDLSSHRWSSRVLASASSNARILVAPHSDYDFNL